MKSFKIVGTVFIVLAVGVYYFGISLDGTRSAIMLDAPEVPQNWSEYSNDQYKFSLHYSPGTVVKEFDEGGGASTIVFEDVVNSRGFQIFVMPYPETQINKERFEADIPSGVIDNLSSTRVGKDGWSGASFDSRDALLGETKEIWFIHGGYLYEVTTLKGLEEWVEEILKTWRFV